MILKSKIQRKEPLYWTTLTSPIPDLPFLAKKAGFDFVVIDALNGAFSSANAASEIIRHCVAIDFPCIYRSYSDVDLIMALDQGATGVACMNIQSQQDMEALIQKVKFYPEGRRRPNPFTPQGRFATENYSSIKKSANEETLVWVFIEETVTSEDQLAEILSVKDVDMAYLGHFVSEKSPETVSMAKAFRKICNANNVGITGFHYDMGDEKYDQADTLKFSIQHPTIVGVSTDLNLIYRGLCSGLSNLKAFHALPQ